MSPHDLPPELPPPPRILLEEARYWRELLDEQGERACIAKAIKFFRARNCLGQRAAAAVIGVDRTSISAWENEARDMQPEVKHHLLSTGRFHPVHLGLPFFYAEE